MRTFVVVGNLAVTSPDFSLNDIPGTSGRMDVLARCVTSAFLRSHGIRKDTVLYLVLLGPPRPPVTLKFAGSHLKYLNPDERSTASLIRRALSLDASAEWRQSTPGIWVRAGSLEDLLQDLNGPLVYLHEDGDDFTPVREAIHVLGDHMGLTEKQESLLDRLGAVRMSLGPLVYHTDHCITIIQNRLDVCSQSSAGRPSC
jgi:tRNA (pseudouridine54-N1)-methyltransferase